MARAIDLNSQEWRDLVFANKNQAYGAYEIRKTSSQRHLMSLGIVILLGLTLSALPMVVKKFFPADNTQRMDNPDGKITLAEYKLTESEKQVIEMIKQAEAVVDLKSTIKFVTPVIKPDEQVKEADEMLTQEALSNTKVAISIATVEGNPDGTIDIVDWDDRNAIVGNPTTDTEIRNFAEQMPTFPGGEKELMSFLSKNIKYPALAIEIGTQGTVILRFVINKEGNVNDITVMRSLDSSCDKEAIRVVKSMPKWTPGRQNGNPVAVYYTLPVKFKLAN